MFSQIATERENKSSRLGHGVGVARLACRPSRNGRMRSRHGARCFDERAQWSEIARPKAIKRGIRERIATSAAADATPRRTNRRRCQGAPESPSPPTATRKMSTRANSSCSRTITSVATAAGDSTCEKRRNSRGRLSSPNRAGIKWLKSWWSETIPRMVRKLGREWRGNTPQMRRARKTHRVN